MPEHIKPMINRNNITYVFETCISTILLQYYLNKWRLKQLVKIDKFYIKAASARIYARVYDLAPRIISFMLATGHTTDHPDSKSVHDTARGRE